MSKQIKSWDDYMDALSELPLPAQSIVRQRILDSVQTDIQLQRFGVPYPHQKPDAS